jgi:Cu(I)/Ag(I) efflux system membrane protein CusA/SilA
MASWGATLPELAAAVQKASSTASGSLIEMSQREYFVRVQGQPPDLQALRDTPLRPGSNQPGPTIGDVAAVSYGPAARRGTADFDGLGEAVGGIAVVRSGQNTLKVMEKLKARIAELAPSLPAGVKLVPVYDRSRLIHAAVDTLTRALAEQLITVVAVILLFLMHFRSTLVPALMLPAAVLLAFAPMKWLGVSSNLMSLGGIVLAVGDLVDAAVVLVDDAHRKLEQLKYPYTRQQRIDAILQACRGVGPPIFFSLLLLVVSFLPVFALEGQGRRLFQPLAMTKTFAMAGAAVLSITLAPALIRLLVRGRIRKESDHPVSKILLRVYRPMAWVALHNPKTTLLMGVFAVLSAIPLAANLGSEFMPALQEGDILYMPTTANGLAIGEAQRALQVQDRVLRAFPEVVSVFGKAGRAETATDPAPLSMIETAVQLKPRAEWRRIQVQRWWHAKKGEPAGWVLGGGDGALAGLLERLFPSERPMNFDELTRQMQSALDQAGWTHAWTMPIKARIDMLSTGIRTPVGIKLFGKDPAELDRAAVVLEKGLADLPGTRSVFAERNLGQWYIDVEPDRQKLHALGLTVGDVDQAVGLGLGGAVVARLPSGRLSVDVQVRLARGYRQSPQDVADLLLPLRPSQAGAVQNLQQSQGSDNAQGSVGSAMGGMGGMGSADPAPSSQQIGKSNGAAQPLPASVRLGDVAKVVVREGPPMLKNEDGQLVGYVYVDVATDLVDVGRWVDEAKARTAKLTLPAGVRLAWTGQYELLIAMQERMQVLVPLTLALMLLLLWLNFRNFAQPLIVLGTVPFALVGSIWLLAALDYRLSTAVWVGLIALVGVAAETGIVMLMYLDEAYDRWKQEGRLNSVDDLRSAVLEGAVQRVRPKLMTVGMNILGLGPVLWATGAGSEVTQRICAPLVGGLLTSTFLTLEIIPVVYVLWRGRGLRLPASAVRPPDQTGQTAS